MKTCLVCDGVIVCDSVVPPSDVSISDYIGLADEASTCGQRFELLHMLGGFYPSAKIHLKCKPSVIVPASFDNSKRTRLRSITDFVLSRGVPRLAAEGIVGDLGLNSDVPFAGLGLTDRLRLELRLAWDSGAELVVFSSEGLSPSGIATIGMDVLRMVGQCAAIHVFPLSLIHFESLNSYSKVVRCSR
jgi:hypothetical protein